MVCFHQLQASDVHIKVHFLLDTLIARTQSFNFCIGQGGFVNVITGTDRRFARHNLADELLLVFKSLPEVSIKGCLGDIAVNVDFRIHVALSDDTTASLFKVARSPRCIKIVQSDKPVLDVHTGSHLKGGTHQHSHLTGTDFAEKFFLASFCVRFMDKSNLFSWNPSCHKLLSDVIVHGEARFFVDAVFLRKVLQSSEFGAVEIAGRCLGSSLCCRAFRCGEVAKNELRQFVIVSFLPNTVDVVHAHIDFACRLVRKVRIDDTLVKTELASIGGNAEHIVNGGINRACMNGCSSLGEFLYHRLLDFCRLCHFVVVDGFWCRQVELVGGFDVCRFFEKVHQLREIKELGKSCSRPIASPLRCKLNGSCGLSKGRCPTVEVSQTLVPNRIML